ncbi:DUF502 domain-containing protein [Ahrensia marina]|uniref:DUF502 domain-containing protein n=1 Tax=Ahrensia marina TaxID=1514904 RepID=UPI0035CF74F6
MARLRNYFFTGVIVVAPITITGYLIWTFVTWVDRIVKPLIPPQYNPDTYLPFAVPGFGLLAGVLIVTMTGFLAANLVGRSVVNFGERLLDRMPLVRTLYRGLKQIFETVLNDRSDNFQSVGLIQYPRPGVWAVVFQSTETRGEVAAKIIGEYGVEDLVSVFLPTTPNPTSGFLLFVPRKDLIQLDMTVEDGAKLVISAGLVVPEHQEKLAQLAAEAQAKHGHPSPRPSIE